MSGLIPLLLPSSASGKPSASSSPTETGRRASLSSSPSPPPPPPLVHRRQQSLPALKTTRRGSLVPPTTIPIIPFTSVEWKNAIDEVKRKYLNRKYRACSARCCEVLDNLKDPSTVEPLYLIYLHFYAASSFELCARPLSCSSTYRTRLLRDAQAHYEKAEELIRNAEENITGRTRSESSSSTTSSLHSPGLSSVRSSVSSTTLSSPRTSVCSVEGIISKSSPRAGVKAKKKVSFSGLNDLIEFQPEPYIRPDSPTLGWEDDIFPHEPENSFPLFLAEKVKPSSLSKFESITAPQPEKVPIESTTTSNHQMLEKSTASEDRFDLDAFLQTRSAHRMCAQLSALRSQVTFHRDGVEALLSEPDETPETPTIPIEAWPIPPSPFTPPRYQNRSNSLPGGIGIDLGSAEKSAPLTAPGLQNSFGGSPVSRPASAASTIRCGDEALQQRIERLRAGGWRRKRFDNRRYEALREQVLGELGA